MASGALHAHKKSLLSMSAPAATAQTGASYRIFGNPVDGIPETQQSFRVYFRNVQAGGATSPTSQVKLQSSYDGTNWFDVASSTQLTADGSKAEMADIAALGPYVRAITLVSGATAPNHTATCLLVSNAAFTLKAA